jgi:hypothetical protein
MPQGILLHQPLPSTFPSRLPAPTLQVGLLDKNIVAFRRYPDLVPFQDVPALAKLLVAEHQRDPTQSLAITATRGWTSAGDSFLSYGTGTGVIHDNGQSLGTIIEILKAARQAGFSTIWLREGVMPHFFDFEQATATGLGAAGTPFWVAGLDDAVLESQIAAHHADVQTCLKGQKSLEIDVVAEVRPDGEVSHATLSESSPSTGSAGSCLVNLVAAWKFPATVDNFGTTLLIPFFTGGTP